MANKSDLEALRQWLSKQPHLPQSLDERLLANFLFCCDYSLENTKHVLELCFTFRADAPEIFRDRDPLSPRIKAVFDTTEICPLPQLTPEGYGVLFVRFFDPDPDKFSFFDTIKLFFMVGDMRARAETQLVTGLVPILDMSGFSLRHLAKAPIMSIKKYIQFCQEGQPVKLRQIHVVNTTPLYDKLFAMFRPFIKDEIVAQVHTHTPGSDTLYKFVSKDLLPSEYGGLAGSLKEIKMDIQRKVEADRDWFLRDEWMADESKRIGKRTDRPNMDGSFRTLSVD